MKYNKGLPALMRGRWETIIMDRPSNNNRLFIKYDKGLSKIHEWIVGKDYKGLWGEKGGGGYLAVGSNLHSLMKILAK